MTIRTVSPARKTVAYLPQVSTRDQNLEKNKADILHFAHQHDLGKVHFAEEVVAGRIPWRERRIAKVMGELQANDVIIVTELSRLGRSMLECMEILSLVTFKGIYVYSVKGNWQLDQTLQSKISLAFSMATEIERDLISQKIKEGLHSKKTQGIKVGRPKGPGKSKLDAFRPDIERLLAHGFTKKSIAQRYNTTAPNLSNWMKKHGLKKARASKPSQ
ncbi:MAG: recombinase family protein [Methylobacter sp.]|jgi:DNA invertase Pin-like site-specific DNA recombinase|nr:recombinase family protein [Methylobacter sp.]